MRLTIATVLALLLWSAPPLAPRAGAQELFGPIGDTDYAARLDPELNFYGVPGLIDMPTAEAMPDGEISINVANFAGTTRTTLGFQLAPRIGGSFRYSALRNWNSESFDTFYDRSFDLRLMLLTEGANRPAVTLGLQDFIGTGLLSGEYLVASKSFADDRVTVTGGLGWGRLGSNGSIGSIATRPDVNVEEGGELNADQLFRGDVAPFGGIAVRPMPGLTLKAEYSSDNYDLEDGERGIFDRKTPVNFGAEYQVNRDLRLGAYALYGSEFGVTAQVSINPKRPPNAGIRDGAPPPVLPRPTREAQPDFYTTSWAQSQNLRGQVRDLASAALRAERMELEALRLAPTEAVMWVRNLGYLASAQAIGRSARIMTRVMPASIETFTVVLVQNGIELPSHTFRRGDLEQLAVQPDGTERILERAAVSTDSVAPETLEFAPGVYPRVTFSFGPYVQTSLFDPEEPVRADVGLQAGVAWRPAPGFVFAGTVRKELIGNVGDGSRDSQSDLPRVRSNFARYEREGDPGIDSLYGAYYFQPAPDFYGRVTAGYLEQMFAGASTEVLWAPYEKRYALGVEVNAVRQRDFQGAFGLQDYDVVTGHASLYWRFTPDFLGQVDVGRYLAGDYGATFGLERVFANGWKVGAFATFTDASSEDFGEGSFDKGITMTVPFDWLLGRSARIKENIVLRPLTRDGGARLEVPGRLFDLTEDGRRYRVEEQWGRFWR